MSKVNKHLEAGSWANVIFPKTDMLSRYWNAKQISKSHPVQVFHGDFAEAMYRNWLSEFLPKRYGVTSGRIVSQRKMANENILLPHYDVIIYDALNSPILWIENTPDNSRQGQVRAIPVEYVCCVLEVKSSFNKVSVDKAIEKLSELKPYAEKIDAPDSYYKEYFPANFCYGTIFFELEKKNANAFKSMQKLANSLGMRGCLGSLVLSGENKNELDTGRLLQGIPSGRVDGVEEEPTDYSVKGEDLLSPTLYDPKTSMLFVWAPIFFPAFHFDLIRFMEGSYQAGRMSAIYGLPPGIN